MAMAAQGRAWAWAWVRVRVWVWVVVQGRDWGGSFQRFVRQARRPGKGKSDWKRKQRRCGREAAEGRRMAVGGWRLASTEERRIEASTMDRPGGCYYHITMEHASASLLEQSLVKTTGAVCQ